MLQKRSAVNIGAVIEHYQLEKHPEGGYYRRTYESTQRQGETVFSTAIYYLLPSGETSQFHSIESDEMWHFYAGSPLKLHVIAPDGSYSQQLIGNEALLSAPPQFTIPAGHIFAAEVTENDSFSFVGCTVTPGFDFSKFRLYSNDEIRSVAKGNIEKFEHMLK